MSIAFIETLHKTLNKIVECDSLEDQLKHVESIEKTTPRLRQRLEVEHELKQHDVHEQVQYLLSLPHHEQRSEEWFAQRKNKLTSSDIDAVLGNNKYSSAEEILFKKNGLARPFTGNEATRHGQKYEDEAIAKYCAMHNKKTFSFGLIPHPTIEFLAGSPDDITYDGIVVEVKCPLRRKIIPGEIPLHYQGQLKMNMEICNLNHGVFIEYKPKEVFGEEELNIVHLERDPDWFSDIFPRLEHFWRDVQAYQGKIETHPRYERYYKLANPPLRPMATSSECLCETFEASDSESDS